MVMMMHRRGVQLNAPTDQPRATSACPEPSRRDQRPPGECHPNGRKIRSDALPEQLDYRDGGCELSPTCLRCPLERCRYDEPGGARRLLIDSRDETLVRRRDDGVGIDALANEFRISRRSVFRVLAKAR